MDNAGNQIVVYQPNETIRLDVRLENETVWLTQEQIANLFGTKRPAITKHLANIYKSGELERDGTCSILEHMGNEGKQSYRTKFYNLDAYPGVATLNMLAKRGRGVKIELVTHSNGELEESDYEVFGDVFKTESQRESAAA